jgi:hypothetical protein
MKGIPRFRLPTRLCNKINKCEFVIDKLNVIGAIIRPETKAFSTTG